MVPRCYISMYTTPSVFHTELLGIQIRQKLYPHVLSLCEIFVGKRLILWYYNHACTCITLFVITCSLWLYLSVDWFNTLRPGQLAATFADDIAKCIFLNEKEWISLNNSLKSVSDVRINNIPSLVEIIARHLPGDKPLFEPMMVSLLTHISLTWPQWIYHSGAKCEYYGGISSTSWLLGLRYVRLEPPCNQTSCHRLCGMVIFTFYFESITQIIDVSV